MAIDLGRRRVLGAVAGLAVIGVPAAANAADAAKLDPNDPTAKQLGYVENAAKLDAKAEPAYKAGSRCAGCALYAVAAEKGGHAPCGAFGGKLVAANGWCRAYVAKA